MNADHDNPIYIVSGFPRSGTSMMMRALEAGGMTCVYSTAGDADRNRNTSIPGYIPNPHGFYETGLTYPDWANWRGKAVKVTRDDLGILPREHRCHVIYVLRDPGEIRRSYRGILSGEFDEAKVFRFLDHYKEKVGADFARLLGAGHHVMRAHYALIVAEPLRAFLDLALAGWPIDAERAASIVDASLYRHRGPA